ncbi:hypothetical protein M514_01492 [Trichuris suis]|uniref:Uncharacterized protein n=1 Tax=Trichuris suis TaxID=68888 RepID=A0A085NIA3_9BILA|nr:hypothetical protein M513_01492 [Trichuris suis]KFD69199.1 hypothetical protein M514_01492 [Trichuris suis]
MSAFLYAVVLFLQTVIRIMSMERNVHYQVLTPCLHYWEAQRRKEDHVQKTSGHKVKEIFLHSRRLKRQFPFYFPHYHQPYIPHVPIIPATLLPLNKPALLPVQMALPPEPPPPVADPIPADSPIDQMLLQMYLSAKIERKHKCQQKLLSCGRTECNLYG